MMRPLPAPALLPMKAWRVVVVLVAMMVPQGAVRALEGPEAGPKDEVWRTGMVARVIDGDTLELGDGQRVRLLDINCPEVAHPGVADALPAEPYGAAATARATALVLGKRVVLRLGPRTYDDYGRLLAHVYVPQQAGQPDLWLNGTLVREGLAVVYTFADNRLRPVPLLGYEREARTARRGLWTLPRWQVLAADTCCTGAGWQRQVGAYTLVDGTVRTVTRQGEVWHLGFGPDWRTDFTVDVGVRDFNRAFKKAGVADSPEEYVGHRVEVRGRLRPVDGMLLKVTHPEQVYVFP